MPRNAAGERGMRSMPYAIKSAGSCIIDAMPFPLDVSIIHPDPDACQALGRPFEALSTVRVTCSTFEDLSPHDAFVTAGNSYGIMTAGIDAAVVRTFGSQIMEAVQFRILNEYLGEQPVGTAMILETGNSRVPFLVHAPTMRMPHDISGSDAVYRATFGALLAIYRHNVNHSQKLRTIGFPVMGTGFGGMSYHEAGRQMAAAYEHYLHPPHRLDWDNAIHRQNTITGGTTGRKPRCD